MGISSVSRCKGLRSLLGAACVLGTFGVAAAASAQDRPADAKIRKALEEMVPDLAQVIVTTTSDGKDGGYVWFYDFTDEAFRQAEYANKNIRLPNNVTPKEDGKFYLFVETGSYCAWVCTYETGGTRCDWKSIPPGGSC